jgi:hypothetical protein
MAESHRMTAAQLADKLLGDQHADVSHPGSCNGCLTRSLLAGRWTSTSRRNQQTTVRTSGLCRLPRSHTRCRAHSEAAYRLGSDRGSPNHGSTLLSKRVKAQIRSPVRVRTNRPVPWRMPVEARR